LLFPVQRLIQCNLLCLGKLLAAAVFSQAQVATVIRTPLAKAAIRARMFFDGCILSHWLNTRFQINLKKAVATEITEVSEEKQQDTTNGLIPFG